MKYLVVFLAIAVALVAAFAAITMKGSESQTATSTPQQVATTTDPADKPTAQEAWDKFKGQGGCVRTTGFTAQSRAYSFSKEGEEVLVGTATEVYKCGELLVIF